MEDYNDCFHFVLHLLACYSPDGRTFADRQRIPTVDPCLHCVCDKSTVVCATPQCALPPGPDPSCLVLTLPGECCPTKVVCRKCKLIFFLQNFVKFYLFFQSCTSAPDMFLRVCVYLSGGCRMNRYIAASHVTWATVYRSYIFVCTCNVLGARYVIYRCRHTRDITSRQLKIIQRTAQSFIFNIPEASKCRGQMISYCTVSKNGDGVVRLGNFLLPDMNKRIISG